MELQIGLKELLIRCFMVILLFFIVNRIFFFSQGAAESTSAYILYPIIKVENFLIDPFIRYLAKKSDIAILEKKIENLSQLNQNLQAKVIELESVLDFKHASKEIIDYAQKYNFSSQKLVQILMRSFDDAGHVFWVDAGSNHGITMNMIAVYQNNIVGRVMHVDPCVCKIALITDKHSKIAVSCLRTKSTGILQGHNNVTPTLEFVPHYETLQQDDIVLSTGQGLVYPQGFALGKISQFFIHDVAYHVQIEPFLDFTTMRYVYLVSM